MQQVDHDDAQLSLSQCIPKYTHHHQEDNIIQSFTAAGEETTRAITHREERTTKEQNVLAIG